MPVTREAVIWAYTFFLGRKPESEDVIRTHMLRARNENSLAEDMIRAAEFRQKRRFSDLIELRAPAPPRPAKPHVSTSKIRMAILGNCQIVPLAGCIRAMTGDVVATPVELTYKELRSAGKGEIDLDLSRVISGCDILLMQPSRAVMRSFKKKSGLALDKIRLFPRIEFSAFHPDLVYIENNEAGGRLKGPLGEYHSSLVIYGWMRGMDVSEILRLFTDEVYLKLGFHDFWKSSRDFLLSEGIKGNLPLDDLLDSWTGRGCFMHSINHPKSFVVADLARAILNSLGIGVLSGAEHYLHDSFADSPVWPVYPEIGQRLGIEGNYLFKAHKSSCPPDKPVLMLGLEDFVRASLQALSKYRKEDCICERMNFEQYHDLESIGNGRRSQKPAIVEPRSDLTKPSRPGKARSAPYDGLPAFHFWGKAIAGAALRDVDPVVSPGFTMDRRTKIATAGSCFAQHISAKLLQNGFNYYIAEPAAGLSSEEAARVNYGVFSARCGNIYTARQLLQLLDRAFGAFNPADLAWQRRDGRYADPFRPRIEPDGFASPQAVESSRNSHLRAVREMFENLDVLVFTLGLTEAWRSRGDGAVFPLAPGVAAGEMDFERYEFVNFQVAEVVADLDDFMQRLAGVNGSARIILTVSPVPLIATFENRHVLLSTTYSKSVLRVAAEAAAARHANCNYFPAYEIITGNYTRGAYYKSDLRTVNAAGVDHVMRLFFAHYCAEPADSSVNQALMREFESVQEVICDEEEIATALAS